MSVEHGGHGGENLEDLPQKNALVSLFIMIFFACLVIPAARDVLQDTSTKIVIGEMHH